MTLSLCSGCVFGCAEHGSLDTTEVGVATYLVWEIPAQRSDELSRSDWTRPRVLTRWVADDGHGDSKELGRKDGLWVVADGRLWEMNFVPGKVSSFDCSTDPPVARDFPTTGVTFVADDGTTREVIPRLARPPGLNPDEALDDPRTNLLGDLSQVHMPVAGLGGLMMFMTDEYSYHCGAHGGVATDYRAYDLSSGQVVDLVGEARASTVAPSLETEVRAALAAKDGWVDDGIELTAVFPKIERGELVARLQYTAPSCYACSDGLWDSYSVSTLVTAPRLPAGLTAVHVPPAMARMGLDTAGGAEPRGWSEVPAGSSVHTKVETTFGGLH